MLDGMGIETGVDIAKVVRTANMICSHLHREVTSKVGGRLLL
jgi:hypothetical protein